jgi:hypothetical protein
MRHRPHDLLCGLVLSLALVGDLPQQVVLRPLATLLNHSTTAYMFWLPWMRPAPVPKIQPALTALIRPTRKEDLKMGRSDG